MKAPVCDDVPCDKPAVWELLAQWTIVDFGTWYACDQHLQLVTEYLMARTVDGWPLLELLTYALDGQGNELGPGAVQ